MLSRHFSVAMLMCAAIMFAIPLGAQETRAGGETLPANGDATPGLSTAEVEAALAAIEADAGIDDAVKDQLRSKYTQAIDLLKEAADFAARRLTRAGVDEARRAAGAVPGDEVQIGDIVFEFWDEMDPGAGDE